MAQAEASAVGVWKGLLWIFKEPWLQVIPQNVRTFAVLFRGGLVGGIVLNRIVKSRKYNRFEKLYKRFLLEKPPINLQKKRIGNEFIQDISPFLSIKS